MLVLYQGFGDTQIVGRVLDRDPVRLSDYDPSKYPSDPASWNELTPVGPSN